VAKPTGKPAKKMPAQGKNELLKGTLDMLVLQTLTVQAQHGYAIAQQIESLSDDALRVEQGSLYPALERLQKKGWITSKWGESPTGRRARYYTLTAAGRRQLGDEISSFDAMLVAINRVLRRA
jgi:PadR family transcriptional regulator PadR